MTLEWLPPIVAPPSPNVRPHLMRSACLRYRIDKSWHAAGHRYFAWHVSTMEHIRVGEFIDIDAAKAACDEHLEQLWRSRHDAR